MASKYDSLRQKMFSTSPTTQMTSKYNNLRQKLLNKSSSEQLIDNPLKNNGIIKFDSELNKSQGTPEFTIENMKLLGKTHGEAESYIKNLPDNIAGNDYKQKLYKYAYNVFTNPVQKFQDTSMSAFNEFMGNSDPVAKDIIQNNNLNPVAKGAANLIGFLGGAELGGGVNTAGTSLLSGATKLGTKAEELVTKLMPDTSKIEAAVAKVLPKAKPEAVKTIATMAEKTPGLAVGGAAGMAPLSLAESALNQRDLKETGKKLAEDTLTGAIATPVIAGAGYGLIKGTPALIKGIAEKIKSGKALTKEEQAVVNSSKFANYTAKTGNYSNNISSIKPSMSKTKYVLPETEEGLQKVYNDMLAKQSQGFKIDLQMFAEIEKKLAAIKERGFSKNVRTDANMNPEIKKSFDENPLIYEELSNKETLKKADEIYSKGFDKAYAEWNKSLGESKFNAYDVPLARKLANEAAQKGDIETARTIITDISEKLTQSGQFSQAAAILRKADPITFQMYMERQIIKLNAEGRQMYGEKWNDVKLTDDEIKAINNKDVLSESERDNLSETIYNRISQQLPSTNMEKFDAWRRIAMLLNPKTHVRNIGGNIIMQDMRKTADTIAAGIEKSTNFVLKKAGKKPIERTKSFGWSSNKNTVDKVNEDWNITKKDLENVSRWDINSLRSLNREKRVFKNNALNAVDKFSKGTLNLEDAPFVERAYKDALGGYLKANNLTEVTNAAREYAKRRALEATFKQTNWLYEAIANWKKKGGLVGKSTEALIPFAKTPANIAFRAFEYSPGGLIKVLYDVGTKKSASTVIEDLSKGLTGSAISGLGFMLANMGWARSEKGKSKNAEAVMTQTGNQPYSIITPLGSYTFDWAQPFAVPFAMGMAVYENLQKKDNIDIDSIVESLAQGGDTIFNMSMLQNIKSLFGGLGGSPTEQIAGLPVSYLQQAYPTVFGQVARTVDNTARNTYDTTGLGKFKRQIMAKTPILSKQLEPKLDIWGNEQKQGSNLVTNALQQFLSPGYYKANSNDATTKEIIRLYKSQNDTSFLPKVAPISLANKGKKIILTPKQVTQFQKEMGQANYKQITILINTKDYKESNDIGKAKMIQRITTRNYDYAKRKFLPKLIIK